MASKRTWGERNTRKLARKRGQAGRGSGSSILRIRSGSGYTKTRGPKALNGPVITVKAPTREITPEEIGLDKRRYAHPDLRLAVLIRDNFKCRYCDIPVILKNANIDHVIPWKKGGRTNIENLVTACQPCNKRKGNKGWTPPTNMKAARKKRNRRRKK